MIGIRKTFLLFVLTVLAATLGCSSATELPAETRQKSQQAYEEGIAAFAQGDYAGAGPKLADALTSGGLNADQYEDAHVRLAVALAASDKIDEALSTLAKIEQGSTIPDQVFAARSYILAKQGKTAESQAAWAQAVRYNRSVQRFGN